jgi:hypothetical protein
MSGETKPIRVPRQVGIEVHAAALVLDMTSAEVLEQAWISYKQTPQFKEDFLSYQQAFASGDLELIADKLNERSLQRAEERAAAANE